MKKLIVIFAALMLSACGKAKSKTETVDVNIQEKGVGPFDLTLSAENESKPNNFSVDINQDEGAVDFYIANGSDRQYLVLDSYSASVQGCNAASVRVVPAWYESEGIADEDGEIRKLGMTMVTAPNTRSRLRVIFGGLAGCKHLDFSMVVKKLPVGALGPGVDGRMSGSWKYGPIASHDIRLFAGASSVGWLEGRGTQVTCDTYLYPSTSATADGGWMVSDDGGLICGYRFESAARSAFAMTCYGTHRYGCTLPKNLRFQRL